MYFLRESLAGNGRVNTYEIYVQHSGIVLFENCRVFDMCLLSMYLERSKGFDFPFLVGMIVKTETALDF